MEVSQRQFKIAISLILAIALVDGLLWITIFTPSANNPAIYFLDVGQGDSELIILEKNIKILVDGGPPGTASKQLEKILPINNRYIDLVIMTHPELDHMGGLIDVIRNYSIGAIISTGRKGPSPEYQELVKIIREKKIPFIALNKGSQITIGDVVLKILSPAKSEIISGNLNDTSIVFILQSKQYKALFAGDIGFDVEKRIINEYDLKVDILKIAHHGSKYSSSDSFLRETRPEVAIIEVGKNSYGHPTKETLDRLARFGSQIITTQELGTIKLSLKKGILDIQSVFDTL